MGYNGMPYFHDKSILVPSENKPSIRHKKEHIYVCFWGEKIERHLPDDASWLCPNLTGQLIRLYIIVASMVPRLNVHEKSWLSLNSQQF